MATFGGLKQGDAIGGWGGYFQVMANWGDCMAQLAYCPSNGFANKISARLYGFLADGTAMAALLKPTAGNIPTDAPYWEYGGGGPDFPSAIAPADVIAKSTLQTITGAAVFTSATWYTFTIPSVPVTAGYYLLAICGKDVGITGQSNEDILNTCAGDNAGGAEHEWPGGTVTFVPSTLLNFGMTFQIECTYQENRMSSNLNGLMDFGKQTSANKF